MPMSPVDAIQLAQSRLPYRDSEAIVSTVDVLYALIQRLAGCAGMTYDHVVTLAPHLCQAANEAAADPQLGLHAFLSYLMIAGTPHQQRYDAAHKAQREGASPGPSPREIVEREAPLGTLGFPLTSSGRV